MGDTPPDQKSPARRWLWFALIWLSGVVAMVAFAMLARALLP